MPLTEHEMDLYLKTKQDLNENQLERARGLIFRSRARWQELGERSTKYFYNLERSRSSQKTSQKLITDCGKQITTDEEILREQFIYYQQLYSKEHDINYEIENRSGITISQEEKNLCGIELQEFEIHKAINTMKRDKTLGPDGHSVEFYQKFWLDIKDIFMEMVQYGYNNKTLPCTTIDGVLNLIPKQGKDSRYLKNLRPITLLNADYKILEKALATRMDMVLPTIINADQNGFMRNRKIAVSIRRVFDLLQYCQNMEKPAALLNLDYVKCFDRISFDSIIGSLRYFDFPQYLTDWIRILYDGFTIRVQNNGKFTQPIKVCRSVHQGRVYLGTTVLNLCGNYCNRTEEHENHNRHIC